MNPSTLAELIRQHGRERGERPALSYGGQTRTYGDLDEESSRLAQALLAEGVGSQDRVAFLDKNTPEYFSFLFGAGKIDAVTLAVNWRLAPREMEYILNHSRAEVLLLGREFLEHVADMGLETVQKIVLIDDPTEASDGIRTVATRGTEIPAETFTSWVRRFEPIDPGHESTPESTCYQLYTSGTTGLPKGVELTNANFFTMLPSGADEWRFGPDSVNLVAMPLFHIAGSGWGVAGLFRGAHNVLLRDVDPAEILRVIPEYAITHALLVPAVLQFLVQTPEAESADFSSLELVIYGASPITEEVLVRSMELFGCDFAQAYGLTETTGGVTILRPEDHDPGGPKARLLRSAGCPWGDVELKIIDPETREEVPDGTVGEVLVKSVQNMKGYWADDEATASSFLGEWFRTGDAGYLEDGFLFIHDRVKDMIVSGGENIYPAEIENVLMGHGAVADVAVIGVPSEKWGETVKAIVVPQPGQKVEERALIDYCRERLAHYKCPTSVDEVADIPRNPSGKILKTELRKPYWEGQERMVR